MSFNQEIIPAILPRTIGELRSGLSRLRGLAQTVQIDVCDNHFVPSTTWPYVGDDGTFAKVSQEEEGLPFWQDFNFEMDLMIKHPESALPQWVAAGAHRIIVHAESASSDVIFEIIEEWGHVVTVGIALHNDTPLAKVTGLLQKVPFVQCMGIRRIGFQGEPFDERTPDRIRELRQAYPNMVISVDGGVTLESSPSLIEAGANRLVAGSAILKATNPKEAIEKFKALG